jgi:hypothetical protein
MASEPTELLPPAGPLDGTEIVHVVQGGNSRRTTLALMLVGALMSWIPAPGLAAVNLQTSLRLGLGAMPDHFGALGDNAADDYQAMQDLATYINGNGGGKVAFRQGATYLINRHIVAGNGVGDVKFIGVNGLTIEGNGAKIRIGGGWDRNVTTTRALCGLRFQDSSNIILRNLEVDGGAATITNSVGNSTGIYSMGVSIESCSGVLVENVYSHDNTMDGFRLDASPNLVGGKFVASKNVVFRNCRAKFNVRLGISIIQVRRFLAECCDFSFTAFKDEAGTATTFLNGGGPKAGVDIEPNNTLTTATLVDVLTGEITFRRCRIVGNSTSSFLCFVMNAGVYRMEDVTIDDCWIDHIDGQTAADAGLIFECPDGKVINSRIDVRDSCAQFGYAAASYANVLVSGNKCYGRMATASGAFVSNQSTSARILIADNDFICTNTAAAAAGTRFFRSLNTNAVVRGNRVVLPAAAYGDYTGNDLMVAITMDGARAENNTYVTDLLAAAGSSATACFGVMYGDNTIVRGDRFLGSAPGWADTIRPGNRTSSALTPWDTNFLWASNVKMAKVTALDLAAVAAGAASPLQNLAVPGAAIGGKVEVESSLTHDGVILAGNVTSVGNVKWWGHNVASGGAWDPAAADYYITVTNRAA